MKDKLVLWDLEVDKGINWSVEKLIDDYEGFRIILRPDNNYSKLLRIEFKDGISYKNTYESYLFNVWHDNDKSILGRIFYLMENSSFIESFHKLNSGWSDDLKLEHYCIYTVSDCIDVLSTTEPEVTFI